MAGRMARRAQNPAVAEDATFRSGLPSWSSRPIWEGLGVAVLAVIAGVYGTIVAGREDAAQRPLPGMREGLELLAIERDVSLVAHDFIAALTMEMYEGGHDAAVGRGLVELEASLVDAHSRLEDAASSDAWRITVTEMSVAVNHALASFGVERSTSGKRAWIDEFLYDFKRVVLTDNLGEWSALLSVATWSLETPLVLREYLDYAMAREWAESGRIPADSALVREYAFSLGAIRRLRESHGDAAGAYTPFEEYIIPEDAAQADAASVLLVARLASHPAVRQVEADYPYLMALTDEHVFGSIEEIFRSRAEWVPELAAITEELRAHAVGQLDAVLSASRRREAFARLGTGLAVLLALIFGLRLVRRRIGMDSRLRDALEHDQLTGLANRYALFSIAPGRLADPEWGSFALIHLDLDDFKSINDDHGHHVGDRALAAFADALTAAVRSSTDLVCRIGGDEFVVLLHRLSDPEAEVESVVARLRQRLETPVDLDGVSLPIRFTAGIAVTSEPGDLEQLLVEADYALLEAKERGREIAQFFRRKLGRRMIHELSTALGSGELRCDFQPQVDMLSGAVTGFEALARWHRADGLQVPTRSLIDALEWLGSSRAWLEVAMREIEAAWRVAGDGVDGRFWLNLMGCDLETKAGGLLDVFSGTDVPLDRIGVEITQGVARARIDDVTRLLAELRAAGMGVALDDVGDDRVPLLHVSELPIDLVKLDRCVITGIDSQPPLRAVVKSLAELCERLGLGVLAEGVETLEEQAVLRQLGIRHVQGYLFARPLPVSALAGYLERGSARTGGTVA